MAVRRPLLLDSGGIREAANSDTLIGPGLARTQILPYTNGGLGGTVAQALAATTAGSVRFAVKLPVNVNRWRIKIRNQDYLLAAKTPATLKKLVVGLHSLTSDNVDSGNFTSNTATTLVSTDQTIPGDGSWYTSPWVTSAPDLFTAYTEFLIGFGYTFASSTSMQTGAGKAWYWANSTSATTPATAASGATVTYIPFDWIIEYECSTDRKVSLVIGDSIWESITGPQGTSSTNFAPTSLWRTVAHLWAHAHNRMLVNMSLAGIKLSDFGYSDQSNASVQYLWNRQALDTFQFDEVLIAAGSNDMSANYTLAQLQAAALMIVNKLRTTYGFSGPIYFATVIPRSFLSGPEGVRTSYNNWLLVSRPSFAAGVIDASGAVTGGTANAISAVYTTDTIHPSYLGCHRLAIEVGYTMS